VAAYRYRQAVSEPLVMQRDARTLVLGDDVNTDDIIPARRCTDPNPAHLARYALEHVVGIAGLQGAYEIIEAGRNFGCGSSREHAPIALKAAGVRHIRARSFAEIFFRNSINIGLELEVIGAPNSDPIIAAIVREGGLTAFNRRRRKGEEVVPSGRTAARAMTMAEKILARASGNAFVRPEETVFAQVDLALSHDAVAAPVAAAFHAAFGADARIWDPQRLVLVADHFIQTNRIRSDEGPHRLYQGMVDFAQAQGCRLFDMVAPGEAAGICHLLLPEEGLIRPGTVVAGTDSHTCTYGAFGCLGVGVGTTDMANLLASGDFWMRVPATIRIDLNGTLRPGVCAKDVMLFLLGQIGCSGATGRVLEIGGTAVAAMSVDERMTLANMAIECGAVCGLIAVDTTTETYVRERTRTAFDAVESDAEAEYERRLCFDLSGLEAQVAQPPRPDHVVAASTLAGVAITRAYIGSCTGGKLSDLEQAAEALRDRHIAPGVQLFIVPASQRVRQAAAERGYLTLFERAGAALLETACGACINAGPGVLSENEVGIYATNRNFTGRSGHPSAKNYLASPRTVALSAIAGHIATA